MIRLPSEAWRSSHIPGKPFKSTTQAGRTVALPRPDDEIGAALEGSDDPAGFARTAAGQQCTGFRQVLRHNVIKGLQGYDTSGQLPHAVMREAWRSPSPPHETRLSLSIRGPGSSFPRRRTSTAEPR